VRKFPKKITLKWCKENSESNVGIEEKMEEKSKTLSDYDSMPFGKYKGDCMEDVPASYLHWLWTNGMDKKKDPVANYIRENLSALEMEDKDKIW